jgi:4-hydroxythreonine-4-phosphate dehydrogenase
MKIDSLYRGDLAGYASALSGGVTIVAPSLPALGRTLVDGRPLVGGVAIAESPAAATWAHEPGSPPRQVSDILDDDHEVIPLRLIRGEGLVGALAATRPRIAVCDGVTDEDLDAIVAASWHLTGVRYLGSGGLAGAIGRKLAGEDGPAIPDAPPAGAAARVLVVVGSAEASARTQLAHLAQSGVPVITVPVITAPVDDEPGSVNETCDRVAAAMGQSETVALTVPSEAIAGGAERIARSLARTVAASLARLDGGSAGNSAGG